MPVAVITLLQLAAAIGGQRPLPELDGLLLNALQQRYPAVARWELHRFPDSAPQRSGPVSVLRLGSRSAVRVADHVYWYSVAGFQRVVSAARTLRAGQPLDPASGEIVDADVMAASCDPVTDITRLQDTRARRTLLAGRVICGNAIEPRPLIARGEEISVLYVGARMMLKTKGVAESDGVLGESISVRKLNAADVYEAVVSGAGEVTIHE
jgi:flagella basal body P-ring formation protein FlgA